MIITHANEVLVPVQLIGTLSELCQQEIYQVAGKALGYVCTDH